MAAFSAASAAKLKAISASDDARSGSSSADHAAFHVSSWAPSIAVLRSARRWATDWNEAMGAPNCWRSVV